MERSLSLPTASRPFVRTDTSVKATTPKVRAVTYTPIRTPSRLVLAARRIRRLWTIEFDFEDLGLDEATLHADLADLFERG